MFKIKFVLSFCLIASVFGLSLGERARYDNYRVYKVVPSSEKELEVLKDLEGSSDSLIFLDGVHIVGRDVEVVVAPHKVPDFLSILGINEIEYQLIEENLEKMLESAPTQSKSRDSVYGWEEYHELETTYSWMQSLTKEFPSIVTLVEGGKTYERRSILGVKIDFSKGRDSKPGVFLEAGIHAREWISPATATYFINQLLTSTDSGIRSVAENYVWYIFPHANPDGYVHTHTTDRLWRKTRAPYGSCYGVDPNRNWGFHWNEIGASNNPCSDTYAGPSAFSEIETKSLSDYIASLQGNIHLYISFHSYSQYLLFPYGHTSDLPENYDDLKQVYDVSIAAINKSYGTTYTGGNIYDAIYPAAGASVDWVYGDLGIKMSFCYELRPSSSSFLTGFRLPAAQIIPTGKETLESVVAMIGEVNRLGYFN